MENLVKSCYFTKNLIKSASKNKKQDQLTEIGFVNLDETNVHERKTGIGDIIPNSHD